MLQRLDSVDEPYINDNAKEEEPNQNFHQANADNITLFERFDSYQANADLYNRFERLIYYHDALLILSC